MRFGLRPMEGGQGFARTVEQVEAAEALGYDSVWLAEHYTPDDQWWPAGLVNLAGLATRTDEITLGTNILIAPLYTPAWLASAVAMLDVIAEGRLVCGLGVGYDPREFDAFGVDLDDRVGRFIETTMVCKRLWTEDEVSFDGRHVSLDEYGIDPKPVQEPHPPIWYGVWGDYLLEQAAQRADAWVPGAVADLDQLQERAERYEAARKSPPSARPIVRDILVADSEAAAMDRARRHLQEKYAIYADRGHQFFEGFSEARFPEFVRDRAILGPPGDCIEQLQRYVDALGTDHFILRFNYQGMAPESVDRDMRRIAEEIMPSFR